MVAPRYGSSGSRIGWRRLSAIEFALALSVIVGLLFVSLRVTTMEFPKTAKFSGAGPQAGTVVVGTEANPLSAAAADTRTP